MAEAGDGSGHTPLTAERTPAPRASHYPWQGDRPAADPSNTIAIITRVFCEAVRSAILATAWLLVLCKLCDFADLL